PLPLNSEPKANTISFSGNEDIKTLSFFESSTLTMSSYTEKPEMQKTNALASEVALVTSNSPPIQDYSVSSESTISYQTSQLMSSSNSNLTGNNVIENNNNLSLAPRNTNSWELKFNEAIDGKQIIIWVDDRGVTKVREIDSITSNNSNLFNPNRVPSANSEFRDIVIQKDGKSFRVFGEISLSAPELTGIPTNAKDVNETVEKEVFDAAENAGLYDLYGKNTIRWSGKVIEVDKDGISLYQIYLRGPLVFGYVKVKHEATVYTDVSHPLWTVDTLGERGRSSKYITTGYLDKEVLVNNVVYDYDITSEAGGFKVETLNLLTEDVVIDKYLGAVKSYSIMGDVKVLSDREDLIRVVDFNNNIKQLIIPDGYNPKDGSRSFVVVDFRGNNRYRGELRTYSIEGNILEADYITHAVNYRYSLDFFSDFPVEAIVVTDFMEGETSFVEKEVLINPYDNTLTANASTWIRADELLFNSEIVRLGLQADSSLYPFLYINLKEGEMAIRYKTEAGKIVAEKIGDQLIVKEGPRYLTNIDDIITNNAALEAYMSALEGNTGRSKKIIDTYRDIYNREGHLLGVRYDTAGMENRQNSTDTGDNLQIVLASAMVSEKAGDKYDVFSRDLFNEIYKQRNSSIGLLVDENIKEVSSTNMYDAYVSFLKHNDTEKANATLSWILDNSVIKEGSRVKTINRGYNDPTWATDAATRLVFNVGPETLAANGVEPYQIYLLIVKNSEVTVPWLEGNVTGLDTTNEEERAIMERNPQVDPVGTGMGIQAFYEIIEYYINQAQDAEANGDIKLAEQYNRWANEIMKKTAIYNEGIDKLILENGAVLGTTLEGAFTFAPENGGWQLIQEPSVAATIWGKGFINSDNDTHRWYNPITGEYGAIEYNSTTDKLEVILINKEEFILNEDINGWLNKDINLETGLKPSYSYEYLKLGTSGIRPFDKDMFTGTYVSPTYPMENILGKDFITKYNLTEDLINFIDIDNRTILIGNTMIDSESGLYKTDYFEHPFTSPKVTTWFNPETQIIHLSFNRLEYDGTIVSSISTTYDSEANTIGNIIFGFNKEDSQNRYLFAEAIREKGFGDIADDISKGEIPSGVYSTKIWLDNSKPAINEWQAISRYYLEIGKTVDLVKITDKDVTINVLDENKEEIGSITYEYVINNDGTVELNEMWGMSLVLEDSPSTEERIIFDVKRYIVWIELRSKIDGAVIDKIDGEYLVDLPKEQEFKDIINMAAKSREQRIENIAEKFSKEINEKLYYGEFDNYSHSHLRALGISNRTESSLVNSEETMLSESQLDNLNVDDKGNARIRFLKQDRYKTEIGVVKENTLEIKNAKGWPIEKHFGEYINNSFVSNMKTYFFYNGGVGKYGIAERTITTIRDEDGEEVIHSYSINTALDNQGNIDYESKRGYSSFKDINYINLENNLDDIDSNFEYSISSWREVKNNKGRLIVIMSGFNMIDENIFYPVGDPRYITLLDYPEIDDKRLSIGSFTYDYIKGSSNKEEYEDMNWVARTDWLGFGDENNLIYKVEDKRNNHKSLKEESLRLDGRILYQIHGGKKGIDNDKKLDFDNRELPEKSFQITKYGGLFSLETKDYSRHYVVFVENKPGHMWIFERDTEDEYFGETFVNGKQISDNSERISVLPEEKIEELAQRDGKYFEYGELIYKRVNRFMPVEWINYEAKGRIEIIKEFFEIHLNEHYKSNAFINIFAQPIKRGTLVPLAVVVGLTGILITLSLPLILLAITKGLRYILFSKIGKKREGTSSVVAGSSEREKLDADSFERKKLDPRFNDIKEIDVRIRHRLMVIIPSLNSIGPFMRYLSNLYEEGGFLEDDINLKKTKEIELLKKFYPKWDGKKNSVSYPKRTDEIWTSYKETYDIELTEIEKLIIEPLSYLFLAAIGYDSKRLNSWTGSWNGEPSPFIENPDLLLVGDRDFRRFFEYTQEDNIDAATDNKFKFNELLPNVRESLVITPNDKDAEIKEQKIKYLNDKVLDPMRDYLKEKYESKGFRPYVFPQPFAVGSKSREYLRIGVLVIGGVILSLSLYFSMGWLTIAFVIALYALFGWQVMETMPMVAFFLNYRIRTFWIIYKTNKEYKGETDDSIKNKKNFFRKLFGFWFLNGIGLTIVSLYFAVGSMHTVGGISLVIGVLILGLNMFVSMRSWWALFIESVRTSMADQGHWEDIRTYKGIPQASIEKVKNDPYLTDVFNTILVEETLLKYHMVTPGEAEELKSALNNNILPSLEGRPRAKKKIVEFFNKVNLYDAKELKEIKKFIEKNPKELLKFFTKITTNNQLGLLPIKDLDNPNADIKTPFYLIKEAYAGDWEVYLIKLATEAGLNE
ncbi:MAG: hypothetical protein KAJ14_09810, partial [Candidatus Omnitrophica bacterium]|nr:hypothetical protein [Candidatus Omnitrophota bacterium]